jgi:chorismate-pyruvate lyase
MTTVDRRQPSEPSDALERGTPELDALAGLFYGSIGELGDFQEVGPAQLPNACRTMLANDRHMTVNLEAHHGSPVDVVVIASGKSEAQYWRKVLLKRRSDGAVVLFGLVRITRSLLSDKIRDQIEGGKIPLGRILIDENVLRNVRLLSLWRILPGRELCEVFGLASRRPCYGRTAFIYCDNAPVIELLEVIMTS